MRGDKRADLLVGFAYITSLEEMVLMRDI
uniref:Uncharacterized protein n=1 Tax=Arundo donax TaxID=35708 RepID=A0A0A8YW44_ARUDO